MTESKIEAMDSKYCEIEYNRNGLQFQGVIERLFKKYIKSCDTSSGNVKGEKYVE